MERLLGAIGERAVDGEIGGSTGKEAAGRPAGMRGRDRTGRAALTGAALLLAGALAACVQPKPVTLVTSFDPQAAAFAAGKGTNRVSGQGFLRQQGGGVVTCAGSPVLLVPVTTYSTERMIARYGSAREGFFDPTRGPTLPPPTPGYETGIRTAQCDGQGDFSFESLPDGAYYLITQVVWFAGYDQQGGSLMQRVSVQGGQTLKILLTRNGG